MRTRVVLSSLLSLTILGLTLSAADAPATPAQVVALVNAQVRSQGPAGDFSGVIVISGGKVTAMGPDAAIPAGATRIDCSNCVITPGLIDSRSQLWLNSAAAREQGRDASLNILDAIDPFDDHWHDAAAQGVTAVYVQPTGSLGGAGAVLRVAPATTVDEIAMKSGVAVQAALGLSGEAARPPQNDQLAAMLAQFGISLPQQPASTPSMSNALTRYSQYESLKGQLDAAKRYGDSKPTKKDPSKELLLKVVKKDIPLRLECGHEDDVRNVLKLANDQGIRIVFERIDRVRPMPDELATGKAPIVVGPLLGRKSGDAKKLALDGRRFVIGTFGDDGAATSWLRAHAAAAVAEGYPRERVLKALTRDAADLMGMGDRLGSIAVGRTADLVVFAGEPLDPGTAVRMTVSQGVVTYENNDAKSPPAIVAIKATVPDRLPPRFVLKTSRLLNSAGEFAPGELHVGDGHLSDAAGKSADLPVIDVGDAPVTPGLVAAMVNLGGDEFPDPDAAHLRALDGLTPDDGRLKALRDAGFPSVVVAPGSANVIAGRVGVVRAGEAADGVEVGMKFVLSSMARQPERYPASLVGQVELCDGWLKGAPRRNDLYLPPSVLNQLSRVRTAPAKELKDKKTTAYFEVNTRAEARAALKLIGDHGLRGVLVAPRQFDDLAEEIRAARAGVILGTARVADGEKARQGIVNLSKAGIPLALAGSDPADMRQTLAWLVNGGLDRAAARKALMAGEAFGVGSRLSPGDRADFVVWDGDPIDPGAKPLAVLISGQRPGKN